MPTERSECEDIPSKKTGAIWTDGSNNCSRYEIEDHFCRKYGRNDYEGDGPANDMCCTCGGGRPISVPGIWYHSAQVPAMALPGSATRAPTPRPTDRSATRAPTPRPTASWQAHRLANRAELYGIAPTSRPTSSPTSSQTPAPLPAFKPSPTSSPTPAPLPLPVPSPGECIDLPSSLDGKSKWSDGFGDCNRYATESDFCQRFGHIDHTGSGMGKDKCCACGGGALLVPKVATIQASCKDLPSTFGGKWSDGTSGCARYAAEPTFCARFGDKDFNGAGKANVKCCACGGGSTSGSPLPMPLPAPMPGPRQLEGSWQGT